MKKVTIFVFFLFAVLALWLFLPKRDRQSESSTNYKTGTYLISGEKINLGREVKYFGNEVDFDINSDGKLDKVFLVERGKDFFVVGAVATEEGYRGTQAMLLGEDISPQSTNILNGSVVVNFAKNYNGESRGESVWLKYDEKDMSFGELVQNFEGESNLPK